MPDPTAVVTSGVDVAVDANGYILLRREGAVATVTINRPAQRNAISFAMWGQLTDLMHQLDSERDVRCVVIAGAGDEAFSAGADISDFEQYRSDSERGRVYNRAVDGLLQTVAEMGTPVISMIRGFAAGGGCELGRGHRPAHRRRGQPVGHPGGPVGHHHWPS